MKMRKTFYVTLTSEVDQYGLPSQMDSALCKVREMLSGVAQVFREEDYEVTVSDGPCCPVLEE